MNITNKQRAAKITNLLRQYTRYQAPEESVTDLLADIRHWCDRHGEDFARLDRMAYEHYSTETVLARKEER